ncbi:MAG: NAD(P)/FAD-dependent oxidoreductase [Christensenellales bacterium]|jgi:glycerol-3-phosphate dehydrogenase
MRVREYDVAVIGAGVTGAAIARQLSRYDIRIALIDAAEDIAMGASRANSAIVHAGYDCAPGSMQARTNVAGNAMFTEWCEQLDVPLMRVGSLVIAFSDEERETLEALYARGVENGVPGMRIISGDEARAIEPMLSDAVTHALYAPTGGITCPYELTIACAENARENGAQWLLGRAVTGLRRAGEGFELSLGEDTIYAARVVNAAGVFADDVARMIGDDSFDVHPRKGEYLLIDRTAKSPRTVIFQTPTKLGKGVLVSPTVHGNAFAGPTAIDTDDKTDTSVCAESIKNLQTLARKSTPDLDFRQVITSFAGIRAQPSTGDFIICASQIEPRLIHAAGICSPGLTSAPAIADMVVDLVRDSGLSMPKKADFNPRRANIRAFRHMTEGEQIAAIAADAGYGRVICRCETITEAEVVEAVRRGARTLDGVKRRCRAGMGRCQGGFCAPRVMEIIAREENIPMETLTKFGGGSYLLAGRTRG